MTLRRLLNTENVSLYLPSVGYFASLNRKRMSLQGHSHREKVHSIHVLPDYSKADFANRKDPLHSDIALFELQVHMLPHASLAGVNKSTSLTACARFSRSTHRTTNGDFPNISEEKQPITFTYVHEMNLRTLSLTGDFVAGKYLLGSDVCHPVDAKAALQIVYCRAVRVAHLQEKPSPSKTTRFVDIITPVRGHVLCRHARVLSSRT